jgi:N-dimethylarginine dimethylaminohydrolase
VAAGSETSCAVVVTPSAPAADRRPDQRRFGGHSMTAPLRRVAVRRPPAALGDADPALWHYAAPVDIAAARAAHDLLLGHLRRTGATVELIDDEPDALADSVFTFDASLVTDAGAIVLRMGKQLRRDEAALHEAFYRSHGIPILGRIEPPGTVEGGDTLWVDERTLAVGRGYRTDDVGIAQLRAILEPLGVEVVAFDLPVHDGPDACLHLLSLVSPLAADLALVHLPLLPVRFLQLLEQRGYRIVVAPADEYESSRAISANVLAVAPRSCVMVDGMPATRRVLEAAGCDVVTFPGDELCQKAEGGPTCLTRPIWRA